MTDISFNHIYPQDFFDQHGDCLLHYIYADVNVISIIHRMKDALPKCNWYSNRIVSTNTRFIMENNDLLAFFADGTLFHSQYADDRMLKNFAEIAAKKGFPVKQKIAVPIDYCSTFRDKIGKLANEKYPAETNFKLLPVKPKDEFISDIFADNNICLTASAGEKICPEHREYLALFSDGRFIVSEKYASRTGIYDYNKINRFMQKYPQYVYFKIEYVPDDYIEAIYNKASEYDWYISPSSICEDPYQPSKEELSKMQKFIAETIKDNPCLSITGLGSPFLYAPEDYHYAFFKNGILVIDKTITYGKEVALNSELQKLFPEQNISIYKVPPFWISEIYKALLKVQKSAKEIYMEMLKQKARKLKKLLNISHYEALELIAKMAGWDNWKQVTKIDEARARFVIHAEKTKKDIATTFNLDPVEYEYKEYLKNNASI